MTFQNIAANTNPILQVNENFQSAAGAGVYGLRQPGVSGLVHGYWGGYFDGADRADGTVTTTASSTNYIVLAKSGYAVSSSTGTTNWNDSTNYWRIGIATTSGSAITAYKDARFGPGGVFSSAGATISLGAVNVWTKNQSVAAMALTDGANIATDASLSNNFKVTLAGNRTLDNPTNPTEGMVVNWAIKQDATGSRTLAYGSAFKFPGGTPPVLSTAANAKDLMSCYYDGSVWLCNMNKAFA